MLGMLMMLAKLGQKLRRTYESTAAKFFMQYPCKIDNVIVNEKTGKTEVVVHITGKPIFLKYSAESLAADINLLEKFPPLHIKTIVELACMETKKAQYEIYSDNLTGAEEGTFYIRNNEDNTIFRATPGELVNNRELLRKFRLKDICSIVSANCELIFSREKANLYSSRKRGFKVVDGGRL